MRLLHVNHRYAPFAGGSERFIEEVSKHRATRGDEVTVVTTDAYDLEYMWDRNARRIDAPERERLSDVDLVRLAVRHHRGDARTFHALRRLSIELGRFPGTERALSRIARLRPDLPTLGTELRAAGDIDAVHATNLGLEGLALAAHAHAVAMGVPFMLTPFLHLGDGPDSYARRHISLPHQRQLMKQAGAVIAMTDRESRMLSALGVDPARIVVTGAGVNICEVTGGDADRFRQRFLLTGNLVGALGAMAPDKGTPDLVTAVADLRTSGHDVELVLAGPELHSFTQWFEKLPSRARQGVHRLGVIDSATKRDFLAAIDVLALPSRTESFGIVYLEAWANRTPVIAADVGAVPDVVQDGETGLLVPFGDAMRIAEAIKRLLVDPDLAGRLARAGEQRVCDAYQWSSVLQRVDQAYDIALSGESRRGKW